MLIGPLTSWSWLISFSQYYKQLRNRHMWANRSSNITILSLKSISRNGITASKCNATHKMQCTFLGFLMYMDILDSRKFIQICILGGVYEAAWHITPSSDLLRSSLSLSTQFFLLPRHGILLFRDSAHLLSHSLIHLFIQCLILNFHVIWPFLKTALLQCNLYTTKGNFRSV